MNVIVQKYGGTSVADSERLRVVAKRVVEAKNTGANVVVVVSAQAGVTNSLLDKAREISSKAAQREVDMILATGEQISIGLLALAIQELGEKAKSFTATQAGILTDNQFGSARIADIQTKEIKRALAEGYIVIIAGFQGVTSSGEITTLGRGGSDITAVALGVALQAESVEIMTDVDGVFTADPRIVHDARKIDFISYAEMLEMAGSGAKVLHLRSVELAAKHHLVIHLRSSLNLSIGTRITEEVFTMESSLVTGIAHERGLARITLHNMADYHTSTVVVLKTIALARINIKLFTQSYIDDHNNSFTIVISNSDFTRAWQIIETIGSGKSESELTGSRDLAMVSVIGVGMKAHAGVAAQVVDILTQHQVSLNYISCSEINISCLIAEKECDKAVIALHRGFSLAAENND